MEKDLLQDFTKICKFSAKQIEGLEAVFTKPYTLWGGSMAAGKTYWLVATAAILNIVYAGHGHAVVGVLATLDQTRVQQRFMDATKELLVDTGLAEVKDGKHGIGIYFKDPQYGVIRFVSLYDWEKIKGLQSPYIGIDELTEIPEEAFQMLMTRARYFKGNRPIDHWPIFAASNPTGPHTDWVCKYFVEKTFDTPIGENMAAHADKFVFVPATLADNPNEEAREIYLDKMLAMGEKDRQAYLYGIWDSLQGSRFPFKLKEIVKSPDIQDHWPVVIGLDWGRSDYSSVVWMAFDEKGNGHVYRHLHVNKSEREPGWGIIQLAREVKQLTTSTELVQGMFCDPTMSAEDPVHGRSLKDYFQDEGLYLEGSTNKHAITNVVIEKYLQPDNGYPSLYFYQCPILSRDLPAVRYGKGKNPENLEPHHNTHSVYALGYGLHGWHENNPVLPDPDPENTAMKRAATKAFLNRFRSQGGIVIKR